MNTDGRAPATSVKCGSEVEGDGAALEAGVGADPAGNGHDRAGQAGDRLHHGNRIGAEALDQFDGDIQAESGKHDLRS